MLRLGRIDKTKSFSLFPTKSPRSGDSTRKGVLSLIQSAIVFQMQPDAFVRPIAETAIDIRTLSVFPSLQSRAIWPKQARCSQCGSVSPQNNVKLNLSPGHCQTSNLKRRGSNQCFSDHDFLDFSLSLYPSNFLFFASARLLSFLPNFHGKEP